MELPCGAALVDYMIYVACALLERGRSRDCQKDYISPTLVMRADVNSYFYQ
jgi:hypothetical protein